MQPFVVISRQGGAHKRAPTIPARTIQATVTNVPFPCFPAMGPLSAATPPLVTTPAKPGEGEAVSVRVRAKTVTVRSIRIDYLPSILSQSVVGRPLRGMLSTETMIIPLVLPSRPAAWLLIHPASRWLPKTLLLPLSRLQLQLAPPHSSGQRQVSLPLLFLRLAVVPTILPVWPWIQTADLALLIARINRKEAAHIARGK